MTNQLPTDARKRKAIPITRGCLDYFPAALAAVAELSRVANEQHNPGEEMHWARGKSQDHADCLVRHLMDRGSVDTDGMRHTAKVAWRALALLQEELEAAGAPLARGARLPTPVPAPAHVLDDHADIDTRKDCDTCEHEECPQHQEPCSSCVGTPRWSEWAPKTACSACRHDGDEDACAVCCSAGGAYAHWQSKP